MPPPDPATQLVVEGPATFAVIDRAHDAMTELWSKHPSIESEDTIALRTAVAELLANVVQHSGATHVRLELGVEPDVLSATIEDDGDDVDLDGDPMMADLDAEHGRGLALIAYLTDARRSRRGGATTWILTRSRRR
jgi:serine/threonine-protein kinase RsbW